MADLQQHSIAVKSNGIHPSLEELRSEPVQEIMGKMPSWIVRRGIFMMAILVAGLFIGAWSFSYPDLVMGRVRISTESGLSAATVTIPATAIWKIHPGQPVLIRLDAYPYEQFGLLQGHVITTEQPKADTGFLVHIQLDHALQTTAGKSIPAVAQLDGSAEIETEKLNLLQRIFGKLIL
ncbi:MAG: hypothetical protein JO154_10425 [Chitinophaga sp.]|uniref:hypothetical protein n=1 Tax=Chitinophaga sp. TaxID=1869181 RepID=UPI0025BF737A|nr:hypothetical protein [Chitinophaga sp.]MBV8253010.1 hypothetical protein [Chitinophaga sp.]